jgi:hypothetical protein
MCSRYCLYNNWYIICSISWWWANKCSKHVQAVKCNKLKANSASCCSVLLYINITMHVKQNFWVVKSLHWKGSCEWNACCHTHTHSKSPDYVTWRGEDRRIIQCLHKTQQFVSLLKHNWNLFWATAWTTSDGSFYLPVV